MSVVRLLLALALALCLAVPAFAAGDVPEQTVTVIEPQAEQRVEPVVASGEQPVTMLGAEGEQQVMTGEEKGPVRRGFETAGKVVLGVFAAGTSLAIMVAAFLL